MSTADLGLLKFLTYKDYLDSFILPEDTRYLRNSHFCRLIVQLGYRSTTAVYTEKQFETNKALALESIYSTVTLGSLFSEGTTSSDPLLRELAARERPNVLKMISTIIFLKIRRPSGFEISGYIDYEHSLRMASRKVDNCVDWSGVFQEKVMLKPSPTNLSYFDWKTGIAKYNNSDNYLVLHDVKDGLMFMHRGDRKKICVDLAKREYARNVSSLILYSEVYGYVILYDHVVRKKI